MRSKGAGPKKQRLLARPIIKILLVTIIGLGLVLSISDMRKIVTVAQKIEAFPLFFAFVATIFSYLFVGLVDICNRSGFARIYAQPRFFRSLLYFFLDSLYRYSQ